MNVLTIYGSSVRCLLSWQAIVGESPVWHPEDQSLFWIDIQRRHIHRYHPATGQNETFDLPEIVTSIGLGSGNELVLTLKKHFAVFNPATSRLEKLAEVEADLPGNRFNDGKCDPQGRFWAGTMDAADWSAPAGNLFRMDAGKLITKMQTGVICSNGSAWSPDSRTMYYTESFRYALFHYDLDPDTGNISNRRPFVTLASNAGFPGWHDRGCGQLRVEQRGGTRTDTP